VNPNKIPTQPLKLLKLLTHWPSSPSSQHYSKYILEYLSCRFIVLPTYLTTDKRLLLLIAQLITENTKSDHRITTNDNMNCEPSYCYLTICIVISISFVERKMRVLLSVEDIQDVDCDMMIEPSVSEFGLGLVRMYVSADTIRWT